MRGCLVWQRFPVFELKITAALEGIRIVDFDSSFEGSLTERFMLPRSLKVLFPCLAFFICLDGTLMGQQPYQPRYSDPLEDRWRWQRLEDLGSHNRRIVVHSSGRAVIQKKESDDRVILYDGWSQDTLLLPDEIQDRPIRVGFGEEGNILMLGYKGAYLYADDAWTTLLTHNLQINTRSEVVRAGNSRFWICGNNGILEFNGTKLIEHQFDEIPSSGVHDLCLGKDGKSLWMVVGPTGDVYRCPIVDDELVPEREWERVYESEREFVHQSWILATEENQIWVVNNHEHDGALIYDIESQSWESHNLRSLGGANFNTSLMQSADGRVWVIGRGSLHLYDDREWVIYKGPDYPIPDGQPYLSQDGQGNVYVVETGAGITRIDYRQDQYRSLSGLHFQAEDLDGDFWYLDVEGHVVHENKATSEWEMFPISETKVDAPVTLIVLDNGDILVAGSDNEEASFSIFDGKEWTPYTHPEFAAGFSHQGILKLHNGDVLLSCGQPQSEYPDILGGMLRVSFEDGEYTVNHHDSVQTSFRPWTIAEDPVDHTIWSGANSLDRIEFGIPVQAGQFAGDIWVDKVAVANNQDVWVALWGNGVFRLRDGEWQNMAEDSVISEHHYSNILLLNGEDPIVSTDQGIYRFDGNIWAPFASPAFSLYRVGGDLRASSDGSFWINETHTDWYYRGLKTEDYPDVKKSFFRTIQVLKDEHPPVTRFYRRPTVFSSRSAMLSWGGGDFWSKTDRQSLTYSYSVDDGPWSPFTSARSMARADWSDGFHTIRVRTRDSDFNIELEPASHTFEVILPMWQKTWAQFVLGLIILLIFGLIVVVAKQRVKHLLELERIKLHFFTNISHELRTPLTLILGPVEKLLQEDKDAASKHNYLRTIQTNTSRLLYLIDQLLDFRRVEQRKYQPDLHPVDLASLIRNIMESFDFMVKEKKQSLTFITPFDTCRYSLDEDSYYKIIDNLIHNAIKYTPPGGSIEIKLSVVPKQGSDLTQRLRLEIKDTGTGISKELIENIFEPFYQGSQKAGKMKQGVGMGLALVNELVDLVKGTIEVESPVRGQGSGTRFVVTLPVAEPELIFKSDQELVALVEERPEDLAEPSEEEENVIRRAHIHLAEDNLDVLNFMHSELANDYEVSVSKDGLAAETFILESIPDLVITDVMMPEQDGFDLCKHLKINPATSHIPVIMLTAFKTKHHEEEGLSLGADDYLAKPVSIRLLKLKITNLLAQQERLRERIRLEYGLLPVASTEIRAVDKEFLDNAEEITNRYLGDEFFGVEQFAEEMGMSRSSFYKKFRDLTGMSPASYVKVRRLNESARRIEVKDGNITEIAFDVGFSDVSYFSRCFKEHFGCPPSKYRAQKVEQRAESEEHRAETKSREPGAESE